MKQGQAESVTLPEAVSGAPRAIELRHLRYLVAVVDAGSFTPAAERVFIAQPTLSQQIRRLEEIVCTPLLQRRRDGSPARRRRRRRRQVPHHQVRSTR